MELKDFTTLEEAQGYTKVTYSKITVGQAGQYFGLTGMLDSLEASQADTTTLTLSPTMSTTVGALCRTILNSAKTSGFACDPATDDGVSNRGAAQLLLAAGVFPNQGIIDGFWAKGETVVTPYSDVSVEEYENARKPILFPPTLTPCEHGGQDFVVSISGKDLFSFVTTTNEPMSSLNLTMYWREDATAVWKQYQSPFVLTGGNGVLSQVLRRPSGINAARHFKFEYTPKYANQIASIAVSVGQ